MWIFYSHFCLFFTCLQKQIYLQVYLDNCAYKIVDKQMIDISWWKSFWNWLRLDHINVVLQKNWYKQRNWSC